MKRLAVDKIIESKAAVVEFPPESASESRLAFLASAAFVSGFAPPDYFLDGILQRGYVYSFTGSTGSGKTAVMLRVMAHGASGRALNGREVTQGRVLMLVGENPDDVRCRWIALCEQMGLFPDELDVYFVPAIFSIPEALSELQHRAEEVGGFSFVVVDTAAAYFDGEDENSNKQLGDHARAVRSLTGLAGRPTVIVNCHPTKNAQSESMVPRGGGAFLAEMDGNLTCGRKDGAIEVHWQGKFRGPEFEPISFELLTVTSDKLKDSRDRHMPTVIARPLTDAELASKVDGQDADLQRLMKALAEQPKVSMADLARACGWVTTVGEPYKSKVFRLLRMLETAKVAHKELDKWTLTSKGEKAVREGKK